MSAFRSRWLRSASAMRDAEQTPRARGRSQFTVVAKASPTCRGSSRYTPASLAPRRSARISAPLPKPSRRWSSSSIQALWLRASKAATSSRSAPLMTTGAVQPRPLLSAPHRTHSTTHQRRWLYCSARSTMRTSHLCKAFARSAKLTLRFSSTIRCCGKQQASIQTWEHLVLGSASRRDWAFLSKLSPPRACEKKPTDTAEPGRISSERRKSRPLPSKLRASLSFPGFPFRSLWYISGPFSVFLVRRSLGTALKENWQASSCGLQTWLPSPCWDGGGSTTIPGPARGPNSIVWINSLACSLRRSASQTP
mmetsp:Transcript_102403/g.318413  ORF Transcript_102403/g.318413 Transcript_102403/m.318413 type:complete len:309 (+) Transcript_102403:365-1291(+)